MESSLEESFESASLVKARAARFYLAIVRSWYGGREYASSTSIHLKMLPSFSASWRTSSKLLKVPMS